MTPSMRRPLVALSFLLCTSPSVAEVLTLSPEEIGRSGVRVAVARESSVRSELRVVGRIVRVPGSSVEVKTLLAGRVERLAVAPGQAVAAGEPLISIHSHALHEMQGELLRAERELSLARNRWQAGKQLLEIEGISRLEVDRREQDVLSAELALATLEAEMEDLGFDEKEIAGFREGSSPHPMLTVRAPVSGTVLDLHVQTQEWIQPWAPLVTLGRTDAVELQLQVPPVEAASIAVGSPVEFRPVARAERSGRAHVTTRVPRIDPTTRTVLLRAEIEDSDAEWLPGLFVEGTLLEVSPRRAVSIPEEAVVRIGERDHVFVELESGTFEARSVELDGGRQGAVEVLAGLAPGERLAVAGVFSLKAALLGQGAED